VRSGRMTEEVISWWDSHVVDLTFLTDGLDTVKQRSTTKKTR
jgi:hypothetical protein